MQGLQILGRSRIRTYVGRSPTVLQTVAFDRSAILPSTNQFLLKQLGTYIITKMKGAVIFSVAIEYFLLFLIHTSRHKIAKIPLWRNLI